MIFRKDFKLRVLLIFMIAPAVSIAQDSFSTRNAKINIFSSTPIEDIKAASDKGTAVLVTRTNEIAFQVPIKSFQFVKGLMQEHFNENYMESDKYPFAKFKGKIDRDIDYSRDGEYDVNASGMLLVHGIEKPRTIKGKIKVLGGKVQVISSFDVACEDHNIKIPRLVVTKIAEVISVKVNAILSQ